MKKITLYIGLNDKDSKKQEIDSIQAFKIVSNLCCIYTEGATIFQAQGIYKHENGTIVIENTLRIEIIEPEEKALLTLIDTLKKVLNQESIIKQEEIVNTVFC